MSIKNRPALGREWELELQLGYVLHTDLPPRVRAMILIIYTIVCFVLSCLFFFQNGDAIYGMMFFRYRTLSF